MSLELVNTLGTVFTAAIIGATAIVAVIQLRHIRASNEVTAFNEALELWYSQPVQHGFRFIQHELKQKMDDPQFRRELDSASVVDHTMHPELNVLDYFDNMGVMVSLGMLREEVILHPASQLLGDLWTTLSPTIAIMRRKRGPQLWVSFEYLAHRARFWQQRYPNGFQAGRWHGLPNPDVWSADTTRAVE